MCSEQKRYVYKETEVRLTGQTARRELLGRESSSRRSLNGRAAYRRIDVLHEITPANDADGSWTKWVRLAELYQITEDETNSNS